jgi:predicted Fe-Mo cluster-binding NifX family protein
MDVRKISQIIVIPVENDNGLTAVLSAHFGRAPFYVVLEIEEGGQIGSANTVPNYHGGKGGCGPHVQNILTHRPNFVISTGMGRGAIDLFQYNGVGVLKAPPGTVETMVKLFTENKLTELTDGCVHAQH